MHFPRMTLSTVKPILFGETVGMTQDPDVFLSTEALEMDICTNSVSRPPGAC